MNHSPIKHRKLYKLLAEKKLMSRRHDIVYAASDGTTENSAELSELQIDDLIEYLENYGEEKPTRSGVAYNGQRMRRRILSMCYSIGWTRFDADQKRHVVDMERLDGWLRKYSHLHKALNDYKYDELPVVVHQFENLMKSVI